MRRRPLIVYGCTSDAGKSLVVTGLCRWFARRGVDVAPYKASNMSNNARVVDGGEIGVAQWLQAGAAGVEPTTDMNPVLVKPEADTRSQVVVQGRARHDLTGVPWQNRHDVLWPAMTEAFDRLAARHELVVMEGAGSPAEINLVDLLNLRIAEHADAAAILVVDIDRGGAFAHLVGTWELLDDATRARVAGFVINKFRGDPTLLGTGPTEVTRRTGMAHLGVLPMLDHQLPDEEGATLRAAPPADAPTVALVRAPYGSNLDEWHLLAGAARLRWAVGPGDLEGVDLVVLPGSKHVAADANWMAKRGIAAAVRTRVAAGGAVLGVCGGAMVLGAEVVDDDGIEGAVDGLGLLPLRTTMSADKTVRRTDVTIGAMDGWWSRLSGATGSGYEIRSGRIEGGGDLRRSDLVWQDGPVLATTVHGLFEDPVIVEALTGIRPPAMLDGTFDVLADAVDAHLDTAAIERVTRGRHDRDR